MAAKVPGSIVAIMLASKFLRRGQQSQSGQNGAVAFAQQQNVNAPTLRAKRQTLGQGEDRTIAALSQRGSDGQAAEHGGT